MTEVDKAAFRRALYEKPPFTKEQGSAAFERYGLGRLLEWSPVEANMINSVYRASSTEGCYFVKIQFRPGFSLKAQEEATLIAREETDLPICDVCILNDDAEPFGHPFLICSSLPGTHGRTLFEEADEALQRQILRGYGSVVACLHRVRAMEHTLPERNYVGWRDKIRRNFLQDSELVNALPTACQARVPIIAELLEDVDVELAPVPQGFLWGDAVLHNLLLENNGKVTGVIDFENAGWGDLLLDQFHVESEFNGRKPREIYGRAGYREEFWHSYEQAGGVRTEPEETYVKVRKAVQAAGFSWFWKAARVLGPRVASNIENLETALRELQRGRLG